MVQILTRSKRFNYLVYALLSGEQTGRELDTVHIVDGYETPSPILYVDRSLSLPLSAPIAGGTIGIVSLSAVLPTVPIKSLTN